MPVKKKKKVVENWRVEVCPCLKSVKVINREGRPHIFSYCNCKPSSFIVRCSSKGEK